ncbi:MAG: hypothetical protein DHS20C01_34630 [marine bacterium B5-7]|nr:MAG: hypothetical protein DHS20C01_34630 [marine bacterium B5-7]
MTIAPNDSQQSEPIQSRPGKVSRTVTFIARSMAVTLAVLAILAWWIPSNLVRLVSKEEFILLGRYGIDHFNVALFLSVLAMVSLYLTFAPASQRGQRRIKVVAISLVVIVSIFVVDLVLRFGFDDSAYVYVGELRLRPPNMQLDIVYEDRPLAQRSLPQVKPGYPNYSMRMTTDADGFRNPDTVKETDILLLGDSFTEGSRVDNDDVWGRRLERASGRSVYNLANSGDDPQKYYAKYDTYGTQLGADTVVVMLYEGNDFRRKQPFQHSIKAYGLGEKIDNYFRFAPLRVRYERLLRNLLGPVGADAPIDEDGVLEWLPFKWRVNDHTSWYYVPPKRIALLFTDTADFAASTGWHTARDAVDAIIARATQKGARVVIAYMPTKSRVMLPLVINQLDGRRVLRYLQLLGERLPPALDDVRDSDQLEQALERHEASIEKVVGSYYHKRGITFVSLTAALRQASASGVQCYFTYDQHLTPDGHRIIADELLNALGLNPSG